MRKSTYTDPLLSQYSHILPAKRFLVPLDLRLVEFKEEVGGYLAK